VGRHPSGQEQRVDGGELRSGGKKVAFAVIAALVAVVEETRLDVVRGEVQLLRG